MRVFVAGASGAIGTRLVPRLVERGHEVVGTTRSPERAERLRGARRRGGRPRRARRPRGPGGRPRCRSRRGRPPGHRARRRVRLQALRPELRGDESDPDHRTDALLAAARESGVERFVAQSYTSWPYAREGGPVKSEDNPLDPAPVPAMRETLAAIRHLEEAVVAFGGVVLRYGGFYGDPGDPQVELVRRRRFPLVGDGGGVWSFVHLDDAAAATVLALERGAPGIDNVVDDDPAPMREWLGTREGRRGEAAPPGPATGRPAPRRGGRGRANDRDPRRLQREGQAGARLDAELPELARGLSGRVRDARHRPGAPPWRALRAPGRGRALTDRTPGRRPREGTVSHTSQVVQTRWRRRDPAA